ncbi:MAG: Crossover junction endodeoxyribonuclease RusA [Planctomycetes bacterium ADurb.Bin126]|nr:MAG: Crossover junction endodeoxyribonuclease RusA [Planctomycetes bacterium ADurb.Bin126]
MTVLTLPYPPSINHYWRHVGPRTLISREGRTFRANVCALLAGGGPRKPPAGGRIALAMDAFPPDRRRRDLDNILKAVLDALGQAGVYGDDSQIDHLLVRRGEPVEGGRVDVQVETLPLQICPVCGRRLATNERTEPCGN